VGRFLLPRARRSVFGCCLTGAPGSPLVFVAARGAIRAGALKISKLLKAGKDGAAQRLTTGFTAFFTILTHGAYEQQVVHVRPGYWVLACFIDTQDGREHT
jgi:hypothetical protein